MLYKIKSCQQLHEWTWRQIFFPSMDLSDEAQTQTTAREQPHEAMVLA